MEIEKYAYEYAVSKGYKIPLYYKNSTLIERMHVRDLFDMFTGTSTGSILATALSLKDPNNKEYPKYWANDAEEIYINSASKLFKQKTVGRYAYNISTVGFVITFGYIFFLCGR
jgi:patatin-like phospholipase/acyl hydrolase